MGLANRWNAGGAAGRVDAAETVEAVETVETVETVGGMAVKVLLLSLVAPFMPQEQFGRKGTQRRIGRRRQTRTPVRPPALACRLRLAPLLHLFYILEALGGCFNCC